MRWKVLLGPLWLLRIFVFALAGFLLISGSFVAITAVTMPGCELCHMRGEFAEMTRAERHAGIECGRCHGADSAATRFTFAAQTTFGMILPIVPAEGRAVSGVEDRVCLSCHEGVLEGLSISRGYRIEHRYCAEGRRCTDCHSRATHGDSVRWPRNSEMEKCLECHPADHVRRTCGMCHDERGPRERLGVGVWRITHGPQWSDTHGMGDNSTCAGCHEREYCARCHGIPLPHDEGYMRVHSGPAMSDAATCERCHTISTYCDGCHGLPMPHSTAFTQIHADEYARADEGACFVCHTDGDCAECHDTHDRHLDFLGIPVDPIDWSGER